jgi:hypothetical protein
MTRTKKIATLFMAAGITLGVTSPAFADPPKDKCNSGNGNQSETDPASDCDPGNSGGHNNGKD